MHARLFQYIFKKNIFRIIPLLILFVFFIPTFVLGKAPEECKKKEKRNANLECFKQLWISEEWSTPNDILTGKASGVVYNGSLPIGQGGFDAYGNLKKISVIATLKLDTDIWRGWNMVVAYFSKWADFRSNATYLRFEDKSFLMRIYQKDALGNAINEKIIFPPNRTFIEDSDTSNVRSQKPVGYFFKFTEGSAYFNSLFRGLTDSSPFKIFFENKQDGYRDTPDSSEIFVIQTGGPVLALNQTANITLDVTGLEKNKETYIELWYAGYPRLSTSKEDTDILPLLSPGFPNNIPKKNDQSDPRIRYFDDGLNVPYFLIGKTGTFKTPNSFGEASQQVLSFQNTTNSLSNNLETTSDDSLPGCSLLGKNGSFLGCIAQLFYYAIYTPISWFAGIMGNLFDFFLGYSISDEAYRAQFIVDAWKIVRDISNIFFIIILVYTGLMAVFNTEGVSMKKVVPNLILNALLINFSLFGTRVIIDVSNVVARLFYNIVDVERTDDTGQPVSANTEGPGGYKPLSEKIVSGFDPQKMFDLRTLSVKQRNAKIIEDRLNPKSVTEPAADVDRDGWEYATYYLLVSILAACIMFAVAMLFWKVSFFFLGRLVGLYLTMIFSPIAVLTRGNMPILGGISQLKWSDWWKELSNYALLAPIFVFFLYIVYLFVSSGFINAGIKDLESGSFFERLLWIAIPLLIVYFILKQGVDIAKKYAGSIGESVQKWGSSITGKVAGFAGGTAIGIASGGVALAGRGLGATAQRIQTNTKFGKWIDRNKKEKTFLGGLARTSNSVLQGTKNASFDPRNSKLVTSQLQKFGNSFNMDLKTDNAVLNAVNLGSKKTAGGFAKYQERKDKEAEEKVEKYKTYFEKDEDAVKFYKETLLKEFQKKTGESKENIERITDDTNKLFKKEAADQLEAKKRSGLITGYSSAEVDRIAKENKERWNKANADRITKYEDFQKDTQKKYGKVKDNKTLTQAMRLRYAENLALDNTSGWNTVRAILGAGIPGLTGDLDRNSDAEKKAYEKYLKDNRKSFKNTEKAAEELSLIDKTLNDILKKMSETDSSFNVHKNSKGEFDHTVMSVDEKNNMIKRRKSDLEAELATHDIELEELKEKVKRSSGPEKVTLKGLYTEAAKERAEVKDEVDELKNILKRRDEAKKKVGGTEGKKMGGSETKTESKPSDDKEPE